MRIDSNYAKENISTEQSPPRQKTRLSRPYGDQKRTRRIETPPRQGTQGINSQTLLDFRLPKSARVLKRRDFLRVYAEGKRFEGRLMTAFILPLNSPQQRVGITATKKAIGKAHKRNRAKRLLRETFRLSKIELGELDTKYDWVLNARRGLLNVKLEDSLRDFRQIFTAVKKATVREAQRTLPIEAQKQ